MRRPSDIIPAHHGVVTAQLRRHESGMSIRNSLIVSRGTIYKTSYIPARSDSKTP
jgi:hypothetical protein